MRRFVVRFARDVWRGWGNAWYLVRSWADDAAFWWFLAAYFAFLSVVAHCA